MLRLISKMFIFHVYVGAYEVHVQVCKSVIVTAE